ncbi:hypothetical protein GQ457_12G029330 [Hibiscus cannabinus]
MDIVRLVQEVEKDQRERIYTKSIQGHVDNEILWTLSKCVIGTTTSACSMNVVKKRLHNWGLGHIRVKSLGGQKFLLHFQDEELLKLIEERNLALLEEVFTEVERWSEQFRVLEKLTWVEVRGVPLHCWNHKTFNRLASLWGNLIALGENANQVIDSERITIIISTNQLKRIEESMIIEVGKEKFHIWIMEISHMALVQAGKKLNSQLEKGFSDVFSSPTSSRQSGKFESHNNMINGDKGSLNENTTAGTEIALGIDKLSKNLKRSINHVDRSMRCDPEEAKRMDSQVWKKSNKEHKESPMNVVSWAEIVGKMKDNIKGDMVSPREALDRVVEDMVGLGLEDSSAHMEEANVSSPKCLDQSSLGSDQEGDLGFEEEGYFELPEFQAHPIILRKRERKFEPLYEILDKVLTVAERKRRDLAKKRHKKRAGEDRFLIWRDAQSPTLISNEEGIFLLLEVKKTLSIGKSVGIDFKGDEDEVVNDLLVIVDRDCLTK